MRPERNGKSSRAFVINPAIGFSLTFIARFVSNIKPLHAKGLATAGSGHLHWLPLCRIDLM